MTEPSPHRRREVTIALAVVALGALVLAPAAWHAAFHCDETTVLRHLTNFAHGDVGRPGRPGLLWLLLAPLTWLGEPATIARAARLVSLAAATGSLGLCWVLASGARADAAGRDNGAGAWAGGAAVALLVGSMAWHGHAFEVRTDSFTTPLTLLLAWRLWRDGLTVRDAVGLGLLVAALGLISQKSIYNVTAVSAGYVAFALAAATPFAARERLRTLAVIGVVAVATVALWFAVISVVSGKGADFVGESMASAARTGFAEDRSFAQKTKPLWGAVRFGPALWGFAGLGLVLAVATPRRHPRLVAASVAGLVMLATIFVHRGFFLYYVASIEPLVAVVAGVPVGLALAALSRRVHPGAAAAVALVALLGVANLAADRRAGFLEVSNAQQLQLMRDVREAFPEPVPYWDQIGLVPGYPESTFFGTGTVRSRFRRAGGAQAFVKRAREQKPRFFLHDYMSRDVYLTGSERRWQWRHFLPYRPNLYLAGGRRLATAVLADVASRFEVLAPGPHTVWFFGGWEGEATVDGRSVAHGDVIELGAGRVEFHARPTSGEGQLWVLGGADRVPRITRSDEQVDWAMFPLASRNRYQQYDRKGKTADLRTQETDPTVDADEDALRQRRHARYQRERDADLGSPRAPR